MDFNVIILALTFLLILLGLASGRLYKSVRRELINPALEIAISSMKSLFVFVAVLVVLFALKQEFDDPQIFTPSNWNSRSTR